VSATLHFRFARSSNAKPVEPTVHFALPTVAAIADDSEGLIDVSRISSPFGASTRYRSFPVRTSWIAKLAPSMTATPSFGASTIR